MKAIGVIPARWGSTRFKGKVLADIAGKPMIQHVWERVKKSELLDDVLIATDDKNVMEVAESFGAKAVLTRSDHPSGSDRIAEAVENIDVDIVLNIQGDEPLIDSSVIDDLVNALLDDDEAVMATAVKKITDFEDFENPNVVKVVIDTEGCAKSFSRSVLAHKGESGRPKYFKHIGIYAYRKPFLFKFTGMPPSKSEKAERLEQLRVLDAGYRIKTVLTDMEMIGVDTKEDLVKVQEIINHNE